MALLTILFIIIIFLILYLVDTYTSNNSNKLYNEIDNDNDKEKADMFINSVNKRIKKSTIDNYRIGNIYDFVMHDDNKAHEFYLQAIDQAKNEPDEDALFVQTRLRDRIQINDIFEIDDTKYNIFNLNALDTELRDLEDTLTRIYEKELYKKPDVPKKLEERVIWISDSQNVHDSNINNALRDGYEQIKKENNGNFLWDINDIINYIQHIYSKESDFTELHNIEPAIDMLHYINTRGANNIVKLNTTEKDFVSNVFTKIYNEPEQQKRKTMMENFMLNLKESYGAGTPVCITGRITRIMTSFSDMDTNNPSLGILKAKPVIKNEIFLKAASIRNKIIDKADKETQDKYNNGVYDKCVEDLENNIKIQIKNMIHADYYKLVKEDPKFIEGIIEEINASL